MNWAVIAYLKWVFPAQLQSREDHVIFEGLEFRSERDLVITLYSKFLILPASFYEDREFYRVWELVESVEDDQDFRDLLGVLVGDIAFEVGFFRRFERIVIACDNADVAFYWAMTCGSNSDFRKVIFRYISLQFKEMLFGANMTSLIERFHQKKREEFIRRFEMVEPEKAEMVRECLSELEVELYLKGDAEFLKMFRNRLNDKGLDHLVDKLFAGDLGL